MADSKFIYCDKTVEIGADKAPFRIAQFVAFLCDGARFSRTGAGLRAAARILDACDEPEADGAIKLDSEAWALLKAEAEEPTPRAVGNGDTIAYPLTPTRQNLAFVDAIRDAADKPRPSAS